MSQTDFVLLVCIPKECALCALVIQQQDESTTSQKLEKTAPRLVRIMFYVYVAALHHLFQRPSGLAGPFSVIITIWLWTLPDNGQFLRCQIEFFSIYISSKCFYPVLVRLIIEELRNKMQTQQFDSLQIVLGCVFFPPQTLAIIVKLPVSAAEHHVTFHQEVNLFRFFFRWYQLWSAPLQPKHPSHNPRVSV